MVNTNNTRFLVMACSHKQILDPEKNTQGDEYITNGKNLTDGVHGMGVSDASRETPANLHFLPSVGIAPAVLPESVPIDC